MKAAIVPSSNSKWEVEAATLPVSLLMCYRSFGFGVKMCGTGENFNNGP